MRRLGSKLSYANVMSTLAVMLALGGSAVAATSMIDGSTITPGSLPANRIKNHTVGAKQIKLPALGKVPKAAHADTAESASSAKTASSATTAASATNATHATSADSATLAANATAVGGAAPTALLGRTLVVIKHSVTVAAGDFASADAMCPTGYEVVGGGVSTNSVIQEKVTDMARASETATAQARARPRPAGS